MDWETVTLSDVCVSIADGDHQPPPKTTAGIPFVTISNITSANQFDFSKTMFVPLDYYERIDDKRKPRKYDVLYSVVGSFGIPVFIKEAIDFVFQRHIAILRADSARILPIFLFYSMLTRDFYAQADAAAIGAAQRTISLSALRNMKVTLPPLPIQHRIASILSAYDDLIENNRRQIKLLEEAAQRLYKEWFVDFKFPGHENVRIVDGVPEGWKKVTVGDVIGKVARPHQIMASDYLPEGDIPVIDQSRDFIAGFTNDKDSIVDINQPIIVFGDHTRILKYITFPFAKGADGTQLIVSNNVNMPQSLLYCCLVNIDLSNYHYARHFKYLKAEHILLPTKAIANNFDTFTSKIYGKIQNLRDLSSKATEARDRLLPKLMSGEIEV